MEAVLLIGGYVCLLPLAMAGTAESAMPDKDAGAAAAAVAGQACAPFIAGISLIVSLALWNMVCAHRNMDCPQKQVLLSEVPRPHTQTPQDQKKGTTKKSQLSQITASEARKFCADGACLDCGALCFADSGTCESCAQRMLCGIMDKGCHECRKQSSVVEGGRGRKLVSALVDPPRPPISSQARHSMDGNVGAPCTDGVASADQARTKGKSSRQPPGLPTQRSVPSFPQVEVDHGRQCTEEQNHETDMTAHNGKEDAFTVLVAAVNASLADKDKAAVARAARFRTATNEELTPHECTRPRGGAHVSGQATSASMTANESEVLTEEHKLPVADAEGPVTGQPESDPSESSELPSRGADKHAQGDCTPCYFFSTSRGCQWGSGCGFCHCEHVKENKQRPSKLRRERTRKLVDSLVVDSNSGQAVEALTSQSQYMNERNRRYLNQVMVKKMSRFEGQAGNKLEKPHTRTGKKFVYQPAGAGNSNKSMHCMWYFSV
mmetsp:Transcript_59147/g.114122  ORF Transcript_59147/g.114122 Transcript_59147/m.114122 type:complete len:492 (-) Transcript_59147:134-1609(-)